MGNFASVIDTMKMNFKSECRESTIESLNAVIDHIQGLCDERFVPKNFIDQSTDTVIELSKLIPHIAGDFPVPMTMSQCYQQTKVILVTYMKTTLYPFQQNRTDLIPRVTSRLSN